MSNSAGRYPFFVYGTLLPGQSNYYLWENSIVSQRQATLFPGRLYDFGTYPMLVETAADEVAGMVMLLEPAAYENILQSLDYLEGFFPLRPETCDYRRVLRQVICEETVVTAWVYLGRPRLVSGKPIVSQGNWLHHLAINQTDINRWWQNITSVAGLHETSGDQPDNAYGYPPTAD